MSHPSVSEAIVTGVPDPLMGERIHGLVVRVDDSQLTAEELKAWVGGRLEKFKVPDAIHFGNEIPRGRTGKADRAQLRRSLADAPAPTRESQE
jgi:acyl-coenzyme A synthetase/AMP-(fatty) acid ligase